MDEAAFSAFVFGRKKDLRRIAGHTRGEYQFDDVVGDAFVLAAELSARPGQTLELTTLEGRFARGRAEDGATQPGEARRRAPHAPFP